MPSEAFSLGGLPERQFLARVSLKPFERCCGPAGLPDQIRSSASRTVRQAAARVAENVIERGQYLPMHACVNADQIPRLLRNCPRSFGIRRRSLTR
jgi:hypothetical protein